MAGGLFLFLDFGFHPPIMSGAKEYYLVGRSLAGYK